MAAAIKALNAKIRSNPTTDYLCSTRTSTCSSKFAGSESGVSNSYPEPGLHALEAIETLGGDGFEKMRYTYLEIKTSC